MARGKTRLDAIDSGARERAQRIDLLRFQTKEIFAAALRPGEELELETERNRLVNAERLTLLIAIAASLAGGDDVAETSGADLLRTATRSLGDAAALDSSWLRCLIG